MSKTGHDLIGERVKMMGVWAGHLRPHQYADHVGSVGEVTSFDPGDGTYYFEFDDGVGCWGYPAAGPTELEKFKADLYDRLIRIAGTAGTVAGVLITEGTRDVARQLITDLNLTPPHKRWKLTVEGTWTVDAEGAGELHDAICQTLLDQLGSQVAGMFSVEVEEEK